MVSARQGARQSKAWQSKSSLVKARAMRQVGRGKGRRTRLKFNGRIDKQDPGWQGSNAKEKDEARKTQIMVRC